jgi:hypothetical protein
VDYLDKQYAILDFKQQLLDAPDGNSIKDGLEVTGNAVAPLKEMEAVDPEWGEFVERQEIEQGSETDAWNIVAEQGQELALRQAVDAMREAEDDEQLLGSALLAATSAPEKYGAFLQELVETYDEEYAQEVHAAVSQHLGERAKDASAIDFMDEMRESDEANHRDVARAIEDLASRKGMSVQDINKMEQSYRSATGEFLRSNMLAIPPSDRDEFLNELAVQAETDDRSERERAFKMSFFTDSRDVADGLRGPGVVPRDLPPSILDPGYQRYVTEQRVRKEDAERASRPTRTSERDIKVGLLAPSSTDIEHGLTDSDGRPTTFRELAAKDPDSMINQEARARERAAWKLGSITGGKVIR